MAERAQIVVKGIVQGVGFRPFVFNLAGDLSLNGHVSNTTDGVLIDIEGDRVSEFVKRLRSEAPPLSRITDLVVTPLPIHGHTNFTIRQSKDQDRSFTLVSPDVSICKDCLRELLDPSDRRHLYPFINCTNCGPRYSITLSVPYDRPNTTMAGFTMCPECRREYDDPRNRRFHAQPNACSACGPDVEFRLRMADETGHAVADCGMKSGKAIKETIKLLQRGGIVAVKGLGGFHIACDAMNETAVRTLRERKRKSNKPFAVMMPDVETIKRYCEVSSQEEELLASSRRPIVLLRKKTGEGLPDVVSPRNQYLGCMLPYTPLHYLLFHPHDENGERISSLVMTSGNLSEEPIVRDNDEASVKLSGFVDAFLVHDRDIFMRVDDSVVRVRNAECGWPMKRATLMRNEQTSRSLQSEIRNQQSEISFIRRSRGYAPDPIELHEEGPEVMGCGADLKNTFTLTKGKFAVTGQHIGDMENYETLKFFEECLENLKSVYRAEPCAIGHDLHPGYLSTRWALNHSALSTQHSAIRLYGIQHHYAHIGSVMAEYGIKRKIMGVAFDGTGYGTDGNLWGGEFIIADIDGFERVGQLSYVPLPGGEAAIKEPWKTAVAYIAQSAGERAERLLEQAGFFQTYNKAAIDQVRKIASLRDFSPLSSGVGRLFDAVAALIKVCDRNTFEGEAAMALEALTRDGMDDQYVIEFKEKEGYTEIDFGPAIQQIIRDLGNDVGQSVIATKFHNTVATAIRTMVRKMSDRFALHDVALSGGTFQNLYLLKRVSAQLAQDGMNVLTNHSVPCNDAGISLGQAYIVRERLKK